MGGVVTREIILNCLTEEQKSNLKGVIFIACPLRGSMMKKEVQDFFGEALIGFFNNFGGPVDESIHKEEF
jgi:hypothetical protein